MAIVTARFNSLISEQLLKGCEDGLTRHGVKSENIDVYRVPGAFEIPFICKKIAAKNKYHAIITLGAIIRGDTPHFDYVAAENSKGIAKVSMDSEIPVIYGVLTTENMEQALERAGVKAGNKGFDAAMSALEMINILKK
ncbi:MAG: 6,7-dimethyl-8-ribityllumazine synthase [Candidatus Muiribacteriota bacterium]